MANLGRPAAPIRRTAKSRGPLVEYLAFVLCGDTYAMPIREVREILKLPPVTEVPRSQPDVIGVVSVRGQLVTVIDLKRRLRLPATELSPKGRILLTQGQGDEVFGLYVDEVLQVYRLAQSEIEPAGNVLGGQLADYVVGIGRPQRDLLVLVDIGPILKRSL